MITSFKGENSWLSNFWVQPFYSGYMGCVLKSVEHGYQALKAEEPEDRQAILDAATPGAAKRLGRSIKCRDDWDKMKLAIMAILICEKFDQLPDLKQKLIDTGDQELVEGNWWGDKYWGVCNGEGCNWLGQLLMLTRRIAREKQNANAKSD